MYFYLARVGFEPMPTLTAAPCKTETAVIPTRPLCSLKRVIMAKVYARFLCIGLLGFVVLKQSSIHMEKVKEHFKPYF